MSDQSSPSIDQLIELPTPSDAQISPDGQWVAYTVTTVGWKENEYIKQIHLVASDGQTPSRQLTFGKSASHSPRWSPDSRSLIFLSERHEDKGSQIYRLSLSGGESERLTELDTSISDLAYAPDGQQVAFVAVPPESPAQKKREKTYGDYSEDNVDYDYTQMWLLTLESKSIVQLTSAEDFHVRDFKWHPHNQRIAVTAMPSPDMGTLIETRIFLLDTLTFACEPLTPQRTFMPCWSPDGTQLLYERGVYDSLEGAFYKNSWLEVISLDDESIAKIDMDFDEDTYPVRWTEAGIYFWAFQRTSIRLMKVSNDRTSAESVIPVEMDDFVSLDYSITADGSRCATVYTTADRYQEVAVIDLDSSEIMILTDFDEPTRAWDLPTHELTSWESEDGTQIEGILTKPHDFDPEKKYPLLVITHGGPTWISLRSRVGGYEKRLYPIYQWVEQGAIVLQPNYRGSAGYGEAFRSLNVRDLGTGDYADVISGVDALINEGYIDESRMGKMGWSQGGYISAFTTTYSDRFAAVSVGAGISNWMTYYVNTDIHPFTINYLKANPWDDPEIYAKTSPMTYVKTANTPTLIQHGEKDQRVPIPNAYELHQGLLDQGVESKLVVYPSMPHGPRKPKQSRHIMNDNLNWFNRHVFRMEMDDIQPLYIVMSSSEDESNLVDAVYHLAHLDDAHYRVVTEEGFLAPDREEVGQSHNLEDIIAITKNLRRVIRAIECKEVIFYSPPVKSYRKSLLILGCLQIVASDVEGLAITHKTSVHDTGDS